MFAFSWTILLICARLVISGFIDVQEDSLVTVDPEEPRRNDTQQKWDIGNGRSLAAPDSKDLLLPLMVGVALKLFSVAPLAFALLGWLSGLGLATGKLALLLSVGLSLYQYFLSQSRPLLIATSTATTGPAKNLGWDNPILGAGAAHAELSPQWYQPHAQPQEEIFHRDRVMQSDFHNNF